MKLPIPIQCPFCTSPPPTCLHGLERDSLSRVFPSSTELCINIFFRQTAFPKRLQFCYTRFYWVHMKLNWNYCSVKMFSGLKNSYCNFNCSSQRVFTFRCLGRTVPPVCPTYNMACTHNVRLWSVTDWRTKSLAYWSHGKQVRKCPQSDSPLASYPNHSKHRNNCNYQSFSSPTNTAV